MDSLTCALDAAFSTKPFRDLLERQDASSLNNRVSELSSQINSPSTYTNREVINSAYNLLRTYYRNEYLFKNLLTNRLFVGRHRAYNATMFTELRVGDSICDAAIFNGTATAYEIKTEFDTPKRLEKQITEYQKVFDTVYVVTHQNSFEQYLDILKDTGIGILALSGRNLALSLKKAARLDLAQIDIQTMFNMLRAHEQLNLVKQLGNDPRIVPNGVRYSYLFELSCQSPPGAVHREFRNIMKSRKLKMTRNAILDKRVNDVRAILMKINSVQERMPVLLHWAENRWS